jgi:dynein heavy chain
MIEKIEEYLEDFNGSQKHPMRLVMFLEACDHVARICRVLRNPQGNALLLGVGGSGRQSLSKLATFMNGYKIYQIEVIKGYSMRDWRDNLKFVLMQAGAEGKTTTFLFVDTQIINEQQLEDLNGVLNSGSVPQLYKAEDMDAITTVGRQECQRKGMPINKMNMMSNYLLRVKANIHLVIAMSPLDGAFRQRLLKFPSLVNCSTLDWFSAWPEEALISVGRGSINDGTVDVGDSLEGCIEMFKVIHKSVEKIRERYLDEARRIAYVTPTSFLELLSSYKTVFKQRKEKVHNDKHRLEKGLQALNEAAAEVAKLEKDLQAKAPDLEKTQKVTAAKKKDIEKENADAAEIKKSVSAEEETAAVQAAEVKRIKDDADADLAVALPALDKAVAAVNKIEVNSFYEMKGVGKPSASMVNMFKLACMMMDKAMAVGKPTAPKDDKGKESDPQGWFTLAKAKLLKNPADFKK